MVMQGRAIELNYVNYRYGFNGKENDDEVKGESNQIDYGERVFDPRVGKFLSVDSYTKKYPGLTPYQFASNTPTSGIDLDGKEFMKYDKSYTSTIVFPRNEYNSDVLIKAEFTYAMKANMNVLIGGSISEINKFLGEKGKAYNNLLFTGHGGFNTSSLRIGDFGYHSSEIEQFKSDLSGLGKFVAKNGSISLLACFQATPKYQEKEFKYADKFLDINLNGEALTKRLSNLTGRQVLASAGEVYSGSKEFSGTYIQNFVPASGDLHGLSAKFAGQWSISYPDGTVKKVDPIILNSDGSYKIVPKTINSQNNGPSNTQGQKKPEVSAPTSN